MKERAGRAVRYAVPLVVMAFLGGGCSTTRHSHSQEQSTFLSSYERLESGGWGRAQYWADSNFKLEDYDRALVPQIKLYVSEASGITPEDAGRLSSMFRDQVTKRLQEVGWEIAKQPGKRTLTLSIALTELNAANPYLNGVTAVTPYLSVGIKALAITADVHVFVGEVSAEMQIVDSSSGEILAEAIDRRVGSQSILNVGSTWGDVEDAMEVWAERIAVGFTKK